MSWLRKRYPEAFRPPSVSGRLLVGAFLGVIAAAFVFIGTSPGERTRFAMDLTWPWRAGHAVLRGRDPYGEVRAIGAYPLDAPFKYPMPAALIGVPFAAFSPAVAAALFTGLSVGLFAFATTRRSWAPLLALTSACAIVSLVVVQFDFLLIAGAMLPMFSFVLAMKPTLAAALFCWRPRVWTAVSCLAICLLSFLIVPNWPREWIEAIRGDPARPVYVAPILQWFGGPLLALAALRWRRPEGRLLLALSCVPHALLFYDELALMLVASTAKEYAILSVLSTAGWAAAHFTNAGGDVVSRAPHYAPFVIFSTYIPALIMVMRRPNISEPEASRETDLTLESSLVNAA